MISNSSTCNYYSFSYFSFPRLCICWSFSRLNKKKTEKKKAFISFILYALGHCFRATTPGQARCSHPTPTWWAMLRQGGGGRPYINLPKHGFKLVLCEFLAVLLLRVSKRRKKNCNNNNLFCFAVHRPEIFYFKGVRRWDRKRSGWAPCSRLSTSKRRLWFYCVYWMRINESFHSTH